MYVYVHYAFLGNNPENCALLDDASACWGKGQAFDPYTFGSCVGSGRTDYVCPVKRFEDS